MAYAASQPLAAVSVDGGATFAPVSFGVPGADLAVTALTADAGGFTAAVQSGAPGQQAVTAWTSAAGTSWTAWSTNYKSLPITSGWAAGWLVLARWP